MLISHPFSPENPTLVIIFRQKFSKKAILAVDKKWSPDIIDMDIR